MWTRILDLLQKEAWKQFASIRLRSLRYLGKMGSYQLEKDSVVSLVVVLLIIIILFSLPLLVEMMMTYISLNQSQKCRPHMWTRILEPFRR